MYETLTRTHDPVPLIPTLKPVSSAVDRIKTVEIKKGRRRDLQILEAKRKREEREKSKVDEGNAESAVDGDEGEPANKKRKVEETDESPAIGDVDEAETMDLQGDGSASASTTRPPTPGTATPSTTNAGPFKIEKEFVLKPGPHSRGHTSFLTFATLLPIMAKDDETRIEDQGKAVEGAEGEAVSSENPLPSTEVI